MIVLRGKTEDSQSAPMILLGLALVRVTKESGDGELTTFDPKLGGLINSGERHQTAVGTADETVWVVRLFNRASGGLQFARYVVVYQSEVREGKKMMRTGRRTD